MDITNGLVPGTRNGQKVYVATDIVDMRAICKRTKRKAPTIHGWRKDPTFPKPVMQLGNSYGWYWPDIMNWMRERTWETWDPIKEQR